jgi:NAD(P)-dependent dehydrogenase (short-subunit alcohol dehydrogenase family)
MTESRHIMTKLASKVALITGGNSGIGQAAALLFAREGAQIVIAARNTAKGASTVNAIEAEGGTALFTVCDVRQPDDCQRAVNAAIAAFGRVDILFNNAGIVPFGTVLDTTPDAWNEVWQINVSGTFFMSRAVLPGMIERGYGVIVNNASDWGITGGHGAAAYATTKGAVVQLTRSMALDHARQGIRVNAVCPGDTAVERWRERRTSDADYEQYLHNLGAVLPMGRVGEPDEIARAVLFLASDDSSYMTGQMLIVDGGNTAGGVSTHY